MDKTEIINALRDTLNEECLTEDVVDQVAIFIDVEPGKKPDRESFLHVCGTPESRLRGLGEVQKAAADLPGSTYEGVEWEWLGQQTDKDGNKVKVPFDELDPAYKIKINKVNDYKTVDFGLASDGTVKYPIPDYLPDYLSYSGTGERKHLKTPWMLFIDWLWLTMKNAGLEPFRYSVDDSGGVEGGSHFRRPVDGAAYQREIETSKWYGPMALDPMYRSRYPTKWKGEIDALNALPSLHGEVPLERLYAIRELAKGKLEKIREAMTDKDNQHRDNAAYILQLLDVVPDIDLLRIWIDREIKEKRAAQQRANEKIKALSRTPLPFKTYSESKELYKIDDDVDCVKFITKGLGTDSLSCAKKLLLILLSAPQPKWFSLDIDERTIKYERDLDDEINVKSSTYGRILVRIKSRQAGYLPGLHDRPTEPDADRSERGKIFLPDFDDEGELDSGTTVDVEALFKKYGPEVGREKYLEIVRNWSSTGRAGMSKRRSARSRKSQKTMLAIIREKKRKIAVSLITDIYEMVLGSDLAKIMEMSSDTVKNAIKKFLINKGAPVDDIENFSDFFECPNDEMNKVLRALKMAKSYFWTHLRDLIENTYKLDNAINEAEVVAAHANISNILNNMPDKVSVVEDNILRLVEFRRKLDHSRKMFINSPNTYATALLVNGYSIDNINNIMEHENIKHTLGKEQIDEVVALRHGAITESIRKYIDNSRLIITSSGSNDRARQIFVRTVNNFGIDDLSHLDKIIPYPVINKDGYLRNGSFNDNLRSMGLSMDELLIKSKNGSAVPPNFWRNVP